MGAGRVARTDGDGAPANTQEKEEASACRAQGPSLSMNAPLARWLDASVIPESEFFRG